MSKITHDRIRTLLSMWSRTARQEMREYVNQQERRDELLYDVKILLEAYDNANFHDDIDEDTMLFFKLKKKLESELNEKI